MKSVRRLAVILLLCIGGASLFTGCGKFWEEETCYTTEELAEKTGSGKKNEDEILQDKLPDGKGARKDKGKIYVHVCGAVKAPGVYELAADSRVSQAIELAGGLAEGALEDSINQARILEDGEQIRILWEEEAAPNSPLASLEIKGEEEGKVNINTGDLEELTKLSGIGESKANAIISYRESVGGFSKVEDLKEVDGIGDATFDKIKDQITVQ